MRVLIVADVHGNGDALAAALAAEPTAGTVFCLGDGVREYEDAERENPRRTFRIVRGNCDFFAPDIPDSGLCDIGGHRVLYLHGHLCGVKQDLFRAETEARSRGADILLFGHTHRTYGEFHGGLYLFNPGSLGYDGLYGVADIEPDSVRFEKRRLR